MKDLKGFVFPLPTPNIFTVYPIEVVHPRDGSQIKAGDKHTVVVAVKEQSFFDKVKKVELQLRDDHGNLVWSGASKFNENGRATVEWTSPSTIGKYVMEARVVGAFGAVNSNSVSKFEVI